MNPFQSRLTNGLKVLTVPMPAESVTALLLVRVGSRDESKTKNGLSHFFEHMVFKGTKKWPSPMELNRVIDSVGGVFNAFTSQEYTGFWVKIAKKHLPRALEFLNQTMFHSLLPAAELEKERGVILEEIKMYEDNPMRFVYDQFVSQVYSATPLGRPIIGTPANIKAVKQADFIGHLQAWYQPQNMVLTVAGGLEKDAGEQIRAVFGGIKSREAGTKRPKITPAGKARTRVIKKDIQQLHFCLGLTTFERSNQDRYVLTLLNTILGGNTSSHLWEEIREKRGLVYYVGSSTDSFFDTGYLVVRAGCDVNRAEEALKVTLDELQKMSHRAGGRELQDAKEYIKGHLALSLEDSQNVADL
ncbi:MAG: pitrilysin family protein, partial [Patescibacteria group bacterium]|nr:pitrilysin family protein [Patescibacteria group bacterium]